MKILLLGAGLVGGPMAADLATDPGVELTVADISSVALQRLSSRFRINAIREDLSDRTAVRRVAAESDLVINAVPGYLGYQTLETLIEAGRNVIDITFAPEDFQKLHTLALDKGVTAICDMGVAPGMSHLLSAYCIGKLDKTDDVKIYVGGLPAVKEWPYEYKAVFSPIDVIEEYTRPARFRFEGNEIVKPALTDIEPMEFEGVGAVEAFNSDGLRSLLTSFNVPSMIEKTLRYPGHVEKMRILRETGFFNTEPVEVHGLMVRPIDVTAKLLFPMIRLGEGEEDITAMLIVVNGEKNGRKMKLSYFLHDRFDPASGVHSMARTTGYSATMAARMFLKGMFPHKGVYPPEALARENEVVPFILKGLADRGVVYHYKEEEIL